MKAREKELLEISRDPVLWASHHLGEKPRWYQEQILRHPHHRIVLRCGRRLGKCIAEDQRILNPETGEYKTVGELYEERAVDFPLYTSTDDYKQQQGVGFQIEDNGEKEVFAITTDSGAQVELTGNHPVLTIDGWKEVDLLEEGEYIAKPKELSHQGSCAPGLDHAELVGALYGGLNISKSGWSIPALSEEIYNRNKKLVEQFGGRTYKRGKQSLGVIPSGFEKRELAREAFQAIPQEVYTYDKEHLKAFLAGMFNVTSSTSYDNKLKIATILYDKKEARDLKHLLLRLGIHTFIKSYRREYPTRVSEWEQVTIMSRENLDKFFSLIYPFMTRDWDEWKALTEKQTVQEPRIPAAMWKYLEEQRVKKDMTKNEVIGLGKYADERLRYEDRVSESKLKRYAENLEDPWLYDLATSDILWERVDSIESVGVKQTYDVMVPKTHNLVVEDIYVHNTWTMAAHMLWGVFTGYGGEITDGAVAIVATPYDSQAKLIFDQLKKFIDANEMLSNSIESITKSPYFIQFKNGGMIKLFTAGSRTGSGAANLRGQKADGYVI